MFGLVGELHSIVDFHGPGHGFAWIFVLADGVRDSSKKIRGLLLQMQNASSTDLLWGHKSFLKRKTDVFSTYFPVERKSHGTVSY